MKYLWYQFNNFYSSTECKDILSFANSNLTKEYVDVPGSGKNVETSIFSIDPSNLIFEKLFRTVTECNESNFGLKLFDRYPNRGNLNVYSGNANNYEYHMDATSPGDMKDLKLTAILNISQESYQGGSFEMFTGKHEEINSVSIPGNLLIFPSFLYHRVNPVVTGVRITASFWFYGPNWK